MKKTSSALAVMAAVLFFIGLSPNTHAQSDDYSRLYQEFLKNLQQQNPTPAETTTEVPVMTQPKVTTSQYSVSGRVTRGDDGRYFITTDENPSRVLRVYGQDLSTEIMKSVVYEKVQLIGEKAYFNGKEVGISVRQIVVLMNGTSPQVVPVAPKPQPVAPQVMVNVETTFRGTIEVSSEGNPFLVTTENNVRVTHRLLNQEDWKKAYLYAYKGEVVVRGYMSATGAIRYSDIWQ